MSTTTLTGHDALAHAARTGAQLHKHADPVDGARAVTLDEARAIAREDAGLIYCTITLPSLVEIAAAKRAAEVNAEGWVEGFGRPYDEPDLGGPSGDIHTDAIAEALGLGEDAGFDLSDDLQIRLWPVYRAALVLRVYELLAQEKG